MKISMAGVNLLIVHIAFCGVLEKGKAQGVKR